MTPLHCLGRLGIAQRRRGVGMTRLRLHVRYCGARFAVCETTRIAV